MQPQIKAPRPRKLEISIGGYPDGYFSLVYRDKVLRYKEASWNSDLVEIEQPTEAQWQTYLSELNRLKVWNWKEDYQPEFVICDGTQWSLWITWGRCKVVSVGDNDYPKGFQSFLKAIRALIGGREFY